MEVWDVLEEEERRLQHEARRYRRRMAALPNGCWTVKTISGRRYAYVVRRIMGRLRFSYVGPAASLAAMRMRRKLLLCRKTKNALRRCERELRRVQRALAPFRAADRPEIHADLARRLPAPGRGDFGEIGASIVDSMTQMEGRATFQLLKR